MTKSINEVYVLLRELQATVLNPNNESYYEELTEETLITKEDRYIIQTRFMVARQQQLIIKITEAEEKRRVSQKKENSCDQDKLNHHFYRPNV